MTISSAILIAANVSLVMTMLCAGMGGIAGDRTYLSCRRGLLVRSLISVLVLQPAFAVWLCYAFDLPTGVKVALLGLAIAPMPPILTSGLMRVRGSRSFEVALAFVVAVAAIATVPASLWAFWWFLDVPPRINMHRTPCTTDNVPNRLPYACGMSIEGDYEPSALGWVRDQVAEYEAS